jgi:dolichol-phosphate mannosyltransferase
MKISIIIPVYNETENLPLLAEELEILDKILDSDYEVIWINDGSRDQSAEVLKKLAGQNPRFKVINFRKNCGQTAAIAAGIAHAQGELIVPMDADLENDPQDIPRLLAKIDEGYDVVSGWRQKRWRGKFFSRRLTSYLANKLISIVTGIKLNDYGCTLKVYRRAYLENVKLYGEMHRFIPAYAAWQGGKVTELVVNFRPRKFGKTKYGLSRTFKVVLDLFFVKFLFKYQDRPIHFFGGLGAVTILISFIFFGWAVYYKLEHLKDFISTPLPTLGALFLIVGVNFILMGILAELFIRVYYEARNKDVYVIKDKINF